LPFFSAGTVTGTLINWLEEEVVVLAEAPDASTPFLVVFIMNLIKNEK
jgi:hypothetical protein